MSTATQQAPAGLLPIEQVVEQAVAAVRLDARENAALAARCQQERGTAFAATLAKVLGIVASDLSAPWMEFCHGGIRFLLQECTEYDAPIEIVQLCSEGCDRTVSADRPIRDHSDLGRYVLERAEPRMCEGCRRTARGKKLTPAERLADAVREIALDAAMEAREL